MCFHLHKNKEKQICEISELRKNLCIAAKNLFITRSCDALSNFVMKTKRFLHEGCWTKFFAQRIKREKLCGTVKKNAKMICDEHCDELWHLWCKVCDEGNVLQCMELVRGNDCAEKSENLLLFSMMDFIRTNPKCWLWSKAFFCRHKFFSV